MTCSGIRVGVRGCLRVCEPENNFPFCSQKMKMCQYFCIDQHRFFDFNNDTESIFQICFIF